MPTKRIDQRRFSTADLGENLDIQSACFKLGSHLYQRVQLANKFFSLVRFGRLDVQEALSKNIHLGNWVDMVLRAAEIGIHGFFQELSVSLGLLSRETNCLIAGHTNLNARRVKLLSRSTCACGQPA